MVPEAFVVFIGDDEVDGSSFGSVALAEEVGEAVGLAVTPDGGDYFFEAGGLRGEFLEGITVLRYWSVRMFRFGGVRIGRGSLGREFRFVIFLFRSFFGFRLGSFCRFLLIFQFGLGSFSVFGL